MPSHHSPHSSSTAPVRAGALALAARLGSWCQHWGSRLPVWRTRGLRAQLTALGGRDGELAELARTVERKFVAIGNSLQAQAELTGRLTEAGRRLVSAGGAGTPGGKTAVKEAVELVHHMLEFTEENNLRVASLIQRMEAYEERITRLLKEEQRVERIVAPLRVIQTLFRIEAAVLPPDMQAAFVALSGEIPKFEQKVRDAFAQHTVVLTETLVRIGRSTERLRDAAARQAAAVTDTRARSRDTLAGIERELAQSRERDARLEAIVRELDQRAGEMVVGLQYQDITRQKMEHVCSVVREIVTRARSPDLTYLFHACRLEAMQSKTIRDDLERAVQGLETGVAAILALIDRIDGECWSRAEFAAAAAAAGGRADILGKSVHGAAELMPQAAAGVEEATALLDSFGNVAATVAATASDMAEDMRMIALNAQVQAAQAGEAGAGLLILAERTYLISEEIKVVTRSIGFEFSEAARELGAAVAQGAILRKLGGAQCTEIASTSGEIERRLAVYRDETVQALEQLAELLAKLEAEAAGLAPQLQVGDDVGAPLDRLYRDLNDLAEAVEPFAVTGAGRAPIAAEFASTKHRYTMASERSVHDAAFAPLSPDETTSLAKAPAGPAGADNVELF